MEEDKIRREREASWRCEVSGYNLIRKGGGSGLEDKN